MLLRVITQYSDLETVRPEAGREGTTNRLNTAEFHSSYQVLEPCMSAVGNPQNQAFQELLAESPT